MANIPKPPRKIKSGIPGRTAIDKKLSQTLRTGFGPGRPVKPGFGGAARPLGSPQAPRRRGGVYRAGGGALLGSLLSGAFSQGGIEELAQGLGRALAGNDLGGDVGEVPPEQEINTLAPAYPVECSHCGATIPAFVWVCEYCSSPRPAEEDKK